MDEETRELTSAAAMLLGHLLTSEGQGPVLEVVQPFSEAAGPGLADMIKHRPADAHVPGSAAGPAGSAEGSGVSAISGDGAVHGQQSGDGIVGELRDALRQMLAADPGRMRALRRLVQDLRDHPRAAEIHLEATASGSGRVFQAARDQHIHVHDGVNVVRRVTQADAASDDCPYPGLSPFKATQEQWFFGRDRLTAELISLAATRLSEGGLVMVVAPSGAGKSSLLRAGLLPALRRGRLPVAGSRLWPHVVFAPTAHPLQAAAASIADLPGAVTDAAEPSPSAEALDRQLAQALQGLAEKPAGAEPRAVVVVDQLEELFTLCTDHAERREFIDWLARLAGASPGRQPGLVICGLRDDYYGACAKYLRAALQDGQIIVGSMTETELRQAILYPAWEAGLDVEPGLVELLLKDLGVGASAAEAAATDPGIPAGQAGYEAGRLPLLAHVLQATWEQRHGSTLTVDGYRITGGIHDAVAKTAERAYNSLGEADRAEARRLFLRLVRIGDTDDTRRRLSSGELADLPKGARTAVDVFTQRRLLTQARDTVEITHEVLLRAWPRLRQWIDEDRAGHLVRQELEETAAAWNRAGRDPGTLYRGNRLEAARAWAADAPHSADLSPVAREFLTVSQRGARRATQLRRGAVAALAALTLFASIAAVFALRQRSTADTLRDNAIFGQITAEAGQLQNTNLSLAAQLDLVAYRLRPNESTYTSLIANESNPLATPLISHLGEVNSIAISPDGHILAAGYENGGVRLWNIANPAHPVPAGRPFADGVGPIRAVALDPTGDYLALSGLGGAAWLWNIARPSHPASLGIIRFARGHTTSSLKFAPRGIGLFAGDENGDVWAGESHGKLKPYPLFAGPGAVYLALSSDGHTLATASSGNSKVRLWKVSTTSIRPTHTLAFAGSDVDALALSPNGHAVAVSDNAPGNSVRVWKLGTPAHPAPQHFPLAAGTDDMFALAFSPDGQLLASGGGSGSVWLWNATDVAGPALVGRPLSAGGGTVSSLAFGPSGHILAAGYSDGTIRLWNIPRTILPVGTDSVASLALSPDGHTLASGDFSGAVRLWNITDPARPVPQGTLTSVEGTAEVAYSQNSPTLAVGNGVGGIRLWSTGESGRLAATGRMNDGKGGGAIYSLVFSPVGHILAGGDYYGTVQLWNTSSTAHPVALGRVTAGTGIAYSMAFTPNGHILAVGYTDGTFRLWNVTNPRNLVPLGSETTGITVRGETVTSNPVQAVAIGPDPDVLVTGYTDGTVRLWNITNPRHPVPLSRLTGGTSQVNWAGFSPDGHVLATADQDGTIRLWNVTRAAHPVLAGQFLATSGSATVAAFGAGGHSLAAGDSAGLIRLWRPSVSSAIDWICATTANTLTRQEWQRYIPLSYNPPCPGTGRAG